MSKTKSGFTLVELLIVIVVIAILAAITIVSYNGVQAKARDTSALSDLSNIAKQMELYNAANGSYPATVATAKSLNASTSINYGNSRVLLCSSASSGFAVFIRDDKANGVVYEVANGMAPQRLATSPSWSAANICALSPYPPVAWGDFWLTNAA